MIRKQPELSEKQREVLEFLVRFIEENGYQPSLKEMAEFFGITKKALRDRIMQLRAKGYVNVPAERQERCLKLSNLRFKAVFVE
jgi:repressor LexA